MNPPPAECEAHARVSRRENRLYVGNLSYDCTYNDLSKFMSGGAFAFRVWSVITRVGMRLGSSLGSGSGDGEGEELGMGSDRIEMDTGCRAARLGALGSRSRAGFRGRLIAA